MTIFKHMNIYNFLLDTLSIGVGVFVALLAVLYILWPKVERLVLKVQTIASGRENRREKAQLRLAAYERLILYCHRISPYQVMLRNHDAGLTVEQFKAALVSDIEQEFQHNITQQLYVSDAAWTVVKNLKDTTITMLTNIQKEASATTVDNYVAAVIKYVAELEVNPYEAAQIILKKEV